MQTKTTFDTSLDLFKAVFETAPDIAVNILANDYTVLWSNRVMAVAVEQSLNEMVGRKCYEVWRRRTSPCPVCLLEIVMDTKEPCIMERWLDLPNKERRYAEVKAYPVFDKNGTVKYAFEIIIPVTSKKRNERKRQKYIHMLEQTLRELDLSVTRATNDLSLQNTLTPREEEVLKLITRGFSNKEIASILSVSSDTIKTHIKRIFSKLDVTDRTQAAVWAASHFDSHPNG